MEFNGTFLVSIISFLVFVYLMNKILYSPLEKIVRARQEFIEGNYAKADENNEKADSLSEERDERLNDAKNDARAKYLESVADFKDQKSEIIKNAQDETENELQQAYQNLDNISNETKENLKGRMTDLANDIVEKVLGYRSEVGGFDDETVNEILYR